MLRLPAGAVTREWLQQQRLGIGAWLRFHWAALVVAGLVVLGYGLVRSREGFGCDGAAYLSHARLLRGLDVGLEGSLDPLRFPALVPLCFERVGRNLVPGMPPGYSVLLAIGGLFRLETMVSPLVGGLTAFLVYLAVQARTRRAVAIAVATLWATSPSAIWGGTEIMGDLSATCALLLSYVLLERTRPTAAGAALGFSLGIRPTNALFSVAALTRFTTWGELFRFGAGAAGGALFWVAFGLGRYGGSNPFAMYGSNATGITYENWTHQLWFIVSTTGLMFPLLVPLAIFAVWRQPRAAVPLILWSAAIVLFYVGWRWKYDAWWWTRHVMPSYPPLVILGAWGLNEMWRWLTQRRVILAAAAVVATANVAWTLSFSSHHGLLEPTGNRDTWIRDVFDLKERLPRRSLVGGVNFTMPLRMYGGIESFRWDHPGAPKLIDYALSQKRKVYLLIEPDLWDRHPAALHLRTTYLITDVRRVRALGIVLRKVEKLDPPSSP